MATRVQEETATEAAAKITEKTEKNFFLLFFVNKKHMR